MESYLNERSQKVTIGYLGTDLGATSKSVALTFGVPKGSVLGLILFTLYQELLGAICRKHGIMYHLYASDQQIYLFKVEKKSFKKLSGMVGKCIKETSTWMTHNVLKLNEEKMEFILFGTQQQLQKVANIILKVGDAEIKLVTSAQNLGYLMDCYMKNSYISTDCSHSCMDLSEGFSKLELV